MEISCIKCGDLKEFLQVTIKNKSHHVWRRKERKKNMDQTLAVICASQTSG